MATDIVQSLFGVTPESYQEAQRQRAQAQAVQMAQLDPMQRAVADIRSGGYNLAQGLGGIMGVEDPMLKQISMQQDLLKTVNFNDPDSIAKAAQTATSFNPQLAAKLADMATGLMGKMVTQAKESALAEENLANAKRIKLDLSNEENAKDTARAALKAQNVPEGQIEAIVANKDARTSYLKKVEEKNQTVEADGKVYLIDKQTGKKVAVIGTAPERGTKISFSPEIQMTDKQLDWRKQYLAENKGVTEQGANVRQALNLLSQSQTSPFADAAFANTVVSAFGGDKQKSKAEIDRLVKAGSLDERIANTLTGFFEGTSSAKTKADQQKVLNAVDKALEARYNASAKGWSEKLTKAKVDPTLVIPDYASVVGNVPTASSLIEGKTYVNQKTGQRAKVVNGKLVPE